MKMAKYTSLNRNECDIPIPPLTAPIEGPCYKVENKCGKPSWSFAIKGTEGGIKNYHPCFRVEKEFNNFKVYYGYEKFGRSLPDSHLIESIDLNQPFKQNIPDIKIPTATQTKDFFHNLLI